MTFYNEFLRINKDQINDDDKLSELQEIFYDSRLRWKLCTDFLFKIATTVLN